MLDIAKSLPYVGTLIGEPGYSVETVPRANPLVAALRDEDAPRLVLDPSVFLSATGLDLVALQLEEEQSRVFASGTFLRLVEEGWEATQPLLDHFLAEGDEPINADGCDLIRRLVEQGRILPYSADSDFARRNVVAQRLARLDRSAEVREILIDEWVFLQSRSWIGARARKTFAWFKDAGAKIIEYSEEAWDRVRDVSGDEIPKLLRSERMHHVAKWVAAAALGVGAAAALAHLGVPVPPDLVFDGVKDVAERMLFAVFDP